ncbi:MAG: hypothetical protein IPO93_17150 [Actinobacteria bacterium]|nr:hypothetical protein [Actinomycetota bacterium]
MAALRWTGIVLLALLTAGAMVIVAAVGSARVQTGTEQAVLDPFYTPPTPLPEALGAVIRMEPLDVSVPNASAYRILYVSETPDGTRAASGGMLFIPDAPAPTEGGPSWRGPTARSAWAMPACPRGRPIPCRTPTTGSTR